MELTSNFKPQDNSSPLNSPTTNNGTQNQTSLPITRSDPNSPYPTTFVTADTSSFKQVVQMLTGSSESNSPKPKPKQSQSNQTHDTTTTSASPTAANGGASSTNYCGTAKGYVIPPIKTTPKKQGFKLYERRNSIKHLISPLTSAATTSNSNQLQTTSFSPRYKQEILSPSLLDFPSLTLSPVTPLVDDPFLKSSPSNFTHGPANGPGSGPGVRPISSSSSEEEKAIAEKGFFLHPSPVSTRRDSQPQLLPLFPLSSPRFSNP